MAWTVDVDGTDITAYCQTIRWRPKLSRPASCIVRYPAYLFSTTVGTSEMHLYNNGNLLFSGPVWFKQDDGDADVVYTELTAYDHLIYFTKHLCKNSSSYDPYDPKNPPPDGSPGPCGFADPTQMLKDNLTGPAIMAAFLQATIDCDPGSIPLSIGSVAGGGTDLTGAPADWPMTLQEMSDQLISTGQLDVVISPGIGSSSVSFYNGDYGTNRTGSVSIQYGTGSYNSPRGNRTLDMETVATAIWYLLGPKTPQYDQDIMHWAGSITRTAANAGYDGEGGTPGTPWPPALVARWTAAEAAYGYFQEVQIHDQREDEQRTVRPLYEEMYANEAWLRAYPREIVSTAPDRTASSPSFYVGDLISMQAGSQLGGGYSGNFRVYEYELSIDTNGVAEMTDLIGSADGEGS